MAIPQDIISKVNRMDIVDQLRFIMPDALGVRPTKRLPLNSSVPAGKTGRSTGGSTSRRPEPGPSPTRSGAASSGSKKKAAWPVTRSGIFKQEQTSSPKGKPQVQARKRSVSTAFGNGESRNIRKRADIEASSSSSSSSSPVSDEIEIPVYPVVHVDMVKCRDLKTCPELRTAIMKVFEQHFADKAMKKVLRGMLHGEASECVQVNFATNFVIVIRGSGTDEAIIVDDSIKPNVFKKSTVIGAAICRCVPNTKGCLELLLIAVDAPHAGHGFGALLHDGVVGAANLFNCNTITVSATGCSHEWYKKRGYNASGAYKYAFTLQNTTPLEMVLPERNMRAKQRTLLRGIPKAKTITFNNGLRIT